MGPVTVPRQNIHASPVWEISPLAVDDPVSRDLLWRYYDDIVSRYYGRPMTRREIDDLLAEDTSDDLAGPTGRFLVGRYGGLPSGCAGVRLLSPGVAELRRVWVVPAARRTGGAASLVSAAERAAVEHLGADVIRLDTRADLVEARALYAKLGYREIDDYNGDRYAGHWFEKPLPQDSGAASPPGSRLGGRAPQ
ncbi:GNAT family N-acetyltransferase [Streptomyces sp. NPDC002574]|uniref:GNAT family N-acetyltransferase n=1 Tax=Streptomyces sp. NPDC002574 TaxID=3364652 RepID=UPI00369D38FC